MKSSKNKIQSLINNCKISKKGMINWKPISTKNPNCCKMVSDQTRLKPNNQRLMIYKGQCDKYSNLITFYSSKKTGKFNKQSLKSNKN